MIQPSDLLPRALMMGSIAGAIFGYGIVTGHYKLFPHRVLESAKDAAIDLAENYKSYLGIEPTKFLTKASGVDAGVTVNNTEATMPGLTLMSGLFDGKVGLQLIDMDGTVVHRWNASFSDIFPEPAHLSDDEVPRNDWDTHVMGAVALPDGSVVFNFLYKGLVKLDRCGAVVWTLPRKTHHSVDVADDGSFWVSGRITTQEETVLHVSPTGEVMREISLPRILIEAGYEGALLPTGAEHARGRSHLNDVNVLGRDEASAFPMFAVGDLMVSMRDLNLVFVFDPDSGKVKWYQTGPWLSQHDPDFAPDGRIIVFNNRRGIDDRPFSGGSNIMAIDPETRQIDIVYAGNDDRPFFTTIGGAEQVLQNGNILITSSKQGRVFEVDHNGTIVWEYVNRYNEDSVVFMEEADRYKYDYFKVKEWRCD